MRLLIAAALLLAAPAHAADRKEVACGYEAQVMAAVQNARLGNVGKSDVAAHITASGPSWPDRYNAAIPGMVEYVFAQKRRDLKKNNLGAVWQEQCLATWDQRQKMLKTLDN